MDLCYNQTTQSKFWGFTEVVVGWERAKSEAELYALCNDYDFMMTYTVSVFCVMMIDRKP